jgi:tRNA pseudouridine38-40 synthase
VLGYRGTRYAGWASQRARQPTLQDTLESTLAESLGHPVHLTAAGRTDAGVHAEGQVVSFETTSTIPPDGLRQVLRTHLPDDIWVVHAAECPPSFNARRSALRRWYRYAIWRGEQPPAAWHGRCLVHPDPLDLSAMRAAAIHLLGKQNFGSFSHRPDRSTIRTVFAADWIEAPPLVTFEICADAFLKQMVRAIVGSLLWVGTSRWTPDQFSAAVAATNRRAAGPTAPPHGLTLYRIEYRSLDGTLTQNV